MACYGTRATCQITESRCLWYGTWRTDTVRVILARDTARRKALPAATTSPGHHRPHRDIRGDHRPLRGPLEHRGHLLRRAMHEGIARRMIERWCVSEVAAPAARGAVGDRRLTGSEILEGGERDLMDPLMRTYNYFSTAYAVFVSMRKCLRQVQGRLCGRPLGCGQPHNSCDWFGERGCLV